MKDTALAFVGDVMLHCKIVDDCKAGRGSEVFAGVRGIFDKVDGTVLNLECAYPTEEIGPKEPRSISSPEAIKLISSLNPFVVCLANNHAFDCGRSGFTGLTSLLDEMNITYFGAGMNIASASQVVIKEINGLKFGFAGYVDSVSTPTHIATSQSCGIALYSADKILESIKTLKGKCDHIVVCLHWGQENLRLPSPAQVAAAHRFIEAGALLVIGHHSHVLQGVEKYKDGLIAYSLGNFVTTETILDSGYKVPRPKLSLLGCILRVEISKQGIVGFEEIPTRIVSGRVEEITGQNADEHIIKANQRVERSITAIRYRWEYFNRRIIKSFFSLIRRRGIFFIRPRHFAMLFKEIRIMIRKS